MLNLKFPHWAMVAMSLLTVLIAWTMKEQSVGDLTLPAAAVSVLSLLSSVLGLLSGSALEPKPTDGAK
jgi:hypothetical protein